VTFVANLDLSNNVYSYTVNTLQKAADSCVTEREWNWTPSN